MASKDLPKDIASGAEGKVREGKKLVRPIKEQQKELKKPIKQMTLHYFIASTDGSIFSGRRSSASSALLWVTAGVMPSKKRGNRVKGGRTPLHCGSGLARDGGLTVD